MSARSGPRAVRVTVTLVAFASPLGCASSPASTGAVDGAPRALDGDAADDGATDRADAPPNEASDAGAYDGPDHVCYAHGVGAIACASGVCAVDDTTSKVTCTPDAAWFYDCGDLRCGDLCGCQSATASACICFPIGGGPLAPPDLAAEPAEREREAHAGARAAC
jgi:hypothetical protein